MQLTSTGFSDGGEIPLELGYKKQNEPPALSINGIPEGTKSLALIMDDPDAMGAVGKVWVQWVVWNIEPTKNPWGKGNPLSKDAFLCDLNEATRAHVYARGHVHSCDEYRGFLRDNDYQTIIFTTPCSKFPDSFLKTHGIGGIVPDMGFTELIIEGDGQVFVHPLVAKPNIKIHREDLDNILRGKKRKAPKRKRKR